MTLGDLVARVAGILERAGIPFMVTGSMASSFHGEPRTTRDLDVVIDPSPEALDALIAALPASDFYVDAATAHAALRERGQFNVVEISSGWKIDFIIRKERPFSREEFGRRVPTELFGQPAFIATAEDTIIAKLEWARAGESERQLRDVAAIIAVSGDRLDQPFVDRWTQALDLVPLWEQARSLAGGASSV